jgi:hypothetical protein
MPHDKPSGREQKPPEGTHGPITVNVLLLDTKKRYWTAAFRLKVPFVASRLHAKSCGDVLVDLRHVTR